MIKKTIRVLGLAILLPLASANGALVQTIQIDTGNGTISPASTLTVSLVGLVADGVTFDADLTVIGSDDLNQISTGLGVDGNTTDLVNSGELLTFSISISNESGGTVVFDGFTEVDYNSFGATDSGVLSADNSEGTTGDNFFTTTTGGENVDISGTSPTTFSAIASPGSGTANSFRIDDVTVSFTGTVAVPEPSSAVLLGLGGLATLLRRRR
jgi:hypothetical protein